MNSLKSISNQELVTQLKKLVSQEQNLTLQILPHLVEVERREIYLEKAYSTMTNYCVNELGYGESSASRRVRAARVIRDMPEVYELLRSRKITLSAVVQVYGVLSPKNKDRLLPRIIGRSRTAIEQVLAEYRAPRHLMDQVKPTMVKKIVPVESAPSRATQKGAGTACAPELGEMTRHCDGSNNPTDESSTPEPVAPELRVVMEKMFEIRFAGDEELMELIRFLRSHLSHRFPKGASFLELFKYALQYIKEREDLATKKVSGRKSTAGTDTRYIPQSIKQKVWKRDGGICTFVGSNGKRCDCDYNLQYDHYPVPFARGGKSTVDNLRLLCAKHNRHAAKKTYGEAAITKHYIKEPRSIYIAGTGPPDDSWVLSDHIH
jgi:5-methylcytosine-specific restriction endonuclease McrA